MIRLALTFAIVSLIAAGARYAADSLDRLDFLVLAGVWFCLLFAIARHIDAAAVGQGQQATELSPVQFLDRLHDLQDKPAPDATAKRAPQVRA